MTATECFDHLLPAALAAHAAAASALNTVLRVTVPSVGDWTITLKGVPSCVPYQPADDAEIRAIVTLSATDCETYLGSTAAGIQLFLDKKLVVTGTNGKEITKLRQALNLLG